MTSKLYVYASLKKTSIQKDALGHTDSGKLAYLSGYMGKKVAIGHVDYPTIVPVRGRSVKGDLLTLKPGDLEKLDNWEREHYKRIKVTLTSGQVAWAYVLKHEYEESAV